MKTIAQQLNVTDFPFKINNKNGNIIYQENSYGDWFRCGFDSNGREISFEDSNGYWSRSEYDSKSNEIYCEDSNGHIIDKRPKSEVQKALDLLEKEGMLVEGKIIKN